ncbi:MAG: DUF4386 domain-containing protein [Pseudomonadota bacterium]
MPHIKNVDNHRRLARAIGAALLAAFGLAIYQTIAANDDALGAAAQESVQAFADVMRSRMLIDAIGVGLAAFVAIGFYFLLQPVNALLSLVASALRFLAAVFSGYGIYVANSVIAESSNASTDALGAAINSLNALNFDLFHWGLIASSLGAALSFALLYVGRFVPRLLAGYGVIASIGAVIGASAIYLAPAISEAMFPAYVAANALAYVSLTIWLLVFGVNVEHWIARA